MASEEKMIEPFEPNQVKSVDGEKIVSYGTSSYGYDVRCSDEFKVFTNLESVIVDPAINNLFLFSLIVSDCELQLVEKSMKNKFIINNLKFISAICFILANINKANNFICFLNQKYIPTYQVVVLRLFVDLCFQAKLKSLYED